MINLRKWFGPMSIARPVYDGQVLCPVQAKDLNVERCMSCAYLSEVAAAEDASPSEIVCKVPLSALRANVEAY